jgi:hypothetical protein
MAPMPTLGLIRGGQSGSCFARPAGISDGLGQLPALDDNAEPPRTADSLLLPAESAALTEVNTGEATRAGTEGRGRPRGAAGHRGDRGGSARGSRRAVNSRVAPAL